MYRDTRFSGALLTNNPSREKFVDEEYIVGINKAYEVKEINNVACPNLLNVGKCHHCLPIQKR